MSEQPLKLIAESTWPLHAAHPLVGRLESAWKSMNAREKQHVVTLQDAGLNWLLATARVCGSFPPSP